MTKNQTVNVKWQVAATLSYITGLYAFKRIDRFRSGVLIYVITIGLWGLAWIGLDQVYENYDYDFYLVIYSLVNVGIIGNGFILPIYYIHKWSKEFNKRIDWLNQPHKNQRFEIDDMSEKADG